MLISDSSPNKEISGEFLQNKTDDADKLIRLFMFYIS